MLTYRHQVDTPDSDGPEEVGDTATPSEAPEATEGQEPAGAAERPEWLPEKFRSAEDLARAYAELEKKQSQPKEDAEGGRGDDGTSERSDEGDEQPKPEGEDAEAVDKAVKAADLDLTQVTAEYQKDGRLSDETLAKLEGAGYPKQMVQEWVAGREALMRQQEQELYGSVGGQEGFDRVVSWAQANLTPQEIDAYNRGIQATKDVAVHKLLVDNLISRWRSAEGEENPRVAPGSQKGDTGYSSADDYLADVGSKKYRESEAFRQKVQRKLSLAMKAGVL